MKINCWYFNQCGREHGGKNIEKLVEEARKHKDEECDNVDVYNDLAIDDSGEDIYLGDGVWISSNGTMHDD